MDENHSRFGFSGPNYESWMAGCEIRLNWPRCFSEVYKKAAFKKLQALKFPV
jgi:hypothetical protein